MNLSDLLSLRPGDVVQLDRGPNDALEVAVSGIPKFSAVSGLANGRLAVRVAEALDDDRAVGVSQPPSQVLRTHS